MPHIICFHSSPSDALSCPLLNGLSRFGGSYLGGECCAQAYVASEDTLGG